MAFEKKWSEERIAEFGKMWNAGVAIDEIAAKFDISSQTVKRYARHNQAFGCVWPQPDPKPKQSVTPAYTGREAIMLKRQTIRPIHSLTMHPGARKRMKDISAVPDDLLAEWSLRLFALMNLTWDYVDTVLDTCAQYRISEVKKESRIMHQLKSEYDRFRWEHMLEGREREETEQGLAFEDLASQQLHLLFVNLKAEAISLGLSQERTTLFISLNQAYTLAEAAKTYARTCDKKIAELGVWVCDCCLVQTEFLKMAELLRIFLKRTNLYILQRIVKPTIKVLAVKLNELPIPQQYLLQAQ